MSKNHYPIVFNEAQIERQQELLFEESINILIDSGYVEFHEIINSDQCLKNVNINELVEFAQNFKEDGIE